MNYNRIPILVLRGLVGKDNSVIRTYKKPKRKQVIRGLDGSPTTFPFILFFVYIAILSNKTKIFSMCVHIKMK